MIWQSWQEDGRKHGTGIQWTHIPGYRGETWNPTVGCTRVSPGCDHCYAFALHDQRHLANRRAASSHTAPLSVGSYQPRAAREAGLGLVMPAQYDLPFSTVQMLEDRLEKPLHWREPRAVFVDSMADLFHEDVPDEFIADVFAVMSMAPQHIFMGLTKRPERMRVLMRHAMFKLYVNASRMRRGVAVLPDSRRPDGTYAWPLTNVWLGVSAERQQEADERIPVLLQTPAAVRFVSIEPCLEEIEISDYLEDWAPEEHAELGWDPTMLDWLIVGGESGKGARSFDLGWARLAVDQGRAAGVPVFVKQLGANPITQRPITSLLPTRSNPMKLRDSHGGDWSEWPPELWVREFPIPVPVEVPA